MCETSGKAFYEPTLGQANKPLQGPARRVCVCHRRAFTLFYLLRTKFSFFSISLLAISHPHLSLTHTMYTYWIPFIGGLLPFSLYRLFSTTVLNYITSPPTTTTVIIFYLLRRIFVGIILLPREITTMSLLDPLTFAQSHLVHFESQPSLTSSIITA